MLTGNPAAPGEAYLDWNDAPRAASYRVWRQLPSETEPVALETVAESELQLEGQPADVPLRFQVSAVNDAGESPLGEAAVITLP